MWPPREVLAGVQLKGVSTAVLPAKTSLKIWVKRAPGRYQVMRLIDKVASATTLTAAGQIGSTSLGISKSP
jgi:hypothetical protein